MTDENGIVYVLSNDQLILLPQENHDKLPKTFCNTGETFFVVDKDEYPKCVFWNHIDLYALENQTSRAFSFCKNAKEFAAKSENFLTKIRLHTVKIVTFYYTARCHGVENLTVKLRH